VTNIGSTIVTAKRALRDLLQARPGLADVQVAYGEPSEYNIESDAIWFTVAESLHHEIAMRNGGAFPIKEDIHLTVIVQAFTFGTDMTMDGREESDLRAIALLHELEQCVSENATSIPGVMMLQLAGWQHFPNEANAAGSGYITRFEVQLRIRAQLN
jgi:hypothetical protein